MPRSSVHSAPEQPLSEPVAELHQRCRSLGLPAWQLDEQAHVISEPTTFGPALRWLQSKPVRHALTRTGRGMLAKAEPHPATLFPGATLVPIAERRRPHRKGLTLVLVLRPEALENKAFARLCREAELDVDQSAEALRQVVPGVSTDGPRHDTDQVREVLDWTRIDLARANDDRQTIDQFSAKLMQSYEEVSLMYRLGQSMRGLSDPIRLMQQTCGELKSILPFAWVSATFTDRPQVVEQLRRRALYAGTLPIGLPEFETQARQFLGSQAAQWERAQVVADGLGASDLGQIIAAPLRNHGTMVGAILAGGKRGDDSEPTSAELKLLGAAADFLSVFHENLAAFAEQKTMFLGTVQALTASIDAKDRYTCGHSQRVALLARQLAEAYGLTSAEIERAHITGLVHDVGKIGIPEAVLGKPGRLTDEEFDQIKRHPGIGHRILADIPPLAQMLPGVRHHHERIDGRGYPDGLSGEQIPLLGRLIGVADTFDAMSSTRSYRDAMPRATVLTEIQRSAGTQLDPELAATFVHLDFTDYDQMLSRHQQDHLRYAA